MSSETQRGSAVFVAMYVFPISAYAPRNDDAKLVFVYAIFLQTSYNSYYKREITRKKLAL